MSNKYQDFFEKPYKEIRNVLKEQITPNSRILDIGCNNGNLEKEIDTYGFNAFVYCLDNDSLELDKLRNEHFSNIDISVLESDANAFLSYRKLRNIDYIILSATLHEINTPDNQPEYLDDFFTKVNSMLSEDGKIIIADYYYHPSVSDSEVHKYMLHQIKAIHHADTRKKFVLPETLVLAAKKNGFKVDYENELRAVKEIDRRYYSFVFSKAE